MIDIGFIAHGRELKRMPIVRELHRLSDALRDTSEETIGIELAFDVPGSIGRPDFEGFELTRRRTGARNVLVFIAVPDAVATASEPLAALVGWAADAISKAAPRSALPEAELMSELARAAGALGIPVSSALHESDQRPDEVVEVIDEEVGLEIDLLLRDQADVDRAFAFEEALADYLEQRGVGYVDGNEVGEALYTIFVYGEGLAALETATTAFIGSYAEGMPVTIRSAPADEQP